MWARAEAAVTAMNLQPSALSQKFATIALTTKPEFMQDKATTDEQELLQREDCFAENELLRCIGEEAAMHVVGWVFDSAWRHINKARINQAAASNTVTYCMEQLNLVVGMMPPPHGTLRRDVGDANYATAFSHMDRNGPERVPTDSWANTRVPHKPSVRDTHTIKTMSCSQAVGKYDEVRLDTAVVCSKGHDRTRDKQFGLRRQGTQFMGQASPGDTKMAVEEVFLGQIFGRLDKDNAGTISVDTLFDFLNMQVEDARVPMQQLKALLIEEGLVDLHGKNVEVHGWSTISKIDFVKFFLGRVSKNPTVTLDVVPIDDDEYSNANGAAELQAILKDREEAEANKRKKPTPSKRDGGSKQAHGTDKNYIDKEKLPDFVNVVAKWPRKKRGDNKDKRPATAMGFEISIEAIDKRLGKGRRSAFEEDVNVQGSIIDCGVSIFSGVTLREVDQKASAAKPHRTVNGLDWPEESVHMSKAKYERLRQGLPDTEPGPIGKEASVLSEKPGPSAKSRPESSMAVSSEAKEFINSMSAHMLDVSPGLAGASERGSPECGDRINVTSSKWLLDEDQQYIFDSIMQMEQEFIGEVRAVGGGDQMTVSKIPRVRAGIARKAQKSAIGRTNRNRPASSGGRRPRFVQSTRERFGGSIGF